MNRQIIRRNRCEFYLTGNLKACGVYGKVRYNGVAEGNALIRITNEETVSKKEV